MSVESSDRESRILELEREAMRLHRRVVDMETWRARALEEGLAMLWTLGPGRTATITGQVRGCASQGFPGAAVTVKDNATGVALGTATCDSGGNYEVSVTLSTDPQSLDVVATPTGAFAARFAASATVNIATAHAGGNAAGTITIGPASGYCCGGVNYYPGDCPWTFTITGCNGVAMSGAVVNLRQSGVLIATCTTNGSGQCTLTVPSGTYDVEVVPSGTGYATNTSTRSHTASQTTSIAIAVDSSYVCIGSCNNPIPKTLHTSDGEGTHALVYDGTNWVGTYVLSATSYDANGLGDCVATGSTTVTITFSVTTLRIAWRYKGCFFATPRIPANGEIRYAPDGASGTTPTDVSAIGTITSCSPFSETFTLPTFDASSPPGPGGFTPGGGGTQVVTL